MVNEDQSGPAFDDELLARMIKSVARRIDIL
jgi:hypothetical protein